MKVKKAWKINQLPLVYIVETADGDLKMFLNMVCRKITEADLQPYKFRHPSKLKNRELPTYEYRWYGLEKI